MSVRQIAKALGLSKSSAQRRAERGMPTGDVVAARAWIAKFDGPMAPSAPRVTRWVERETLQMRQAAEAERTEGLSELPRGIDAQTSTHTADDASAAGQGQRQELRGGLQASGQTDSAAVRDVQQPQPGNAPHGLQPAAPSSLGVPAVPVKPERQALDGYAAERVEREKIRRQREQIALDDLLGRSLNAEDAARAAFTAFRTLRDQAENLGPRLKDQLAAETDPFIVEQMIAAEVRKVFAAFSVADALKEPADDEGPEE